MELGGYVLAPLPASVGCPMQNSDVRFTLYVYDERSSSSDERGGAV